MYTLAIGIICSSTHPNFQHNLIHSDNVIPTHLKPSSLPLQSLNPHQQQPSQIGFQTGFKWSFSETASDQSQIGWTANRGDGSSPSK